MSLKVVHLFTSDAGGAGIAALRLHQGLLAEGLSSRVICAEGRNNYDGEYIAPHPIARLSRVLRKIGLDKDIIQEYRSDVKRAGGTYESFSMPVSYYRVERHPSVEAADIVHLHSISNYINYPDFFKSVDKPLVWTLHDMNPLMGGFHYDQDQRRNENNEALMQIEREFLRIKLTSMTSFPAITVCAPSQWLKTESMKSELMGGYEHHHISYGLDTNIFKLHQKRLCRELLELPQDKKLLLFVSENVLNRRKGFDLLLDALRTLPPSRDYALLAAGAAPIDNNIPNVSTIGSIRDPKLLAMLYSAADAFILPSRQDNLPNVMLESLVCGTPVIGFPIGGVEETIKDGFNGLLCDEVSANALGRAIGRFLGSSGFDAGQIREDSMERFALARQARRYVNIYYTLANGDAGRN
jgi:glycosyltransferase involved in cell wall biosynthesis